MESFPLFYKIRAAAFICMMLFSFLWLVLLCVEMFTRWSVSDHISQSLMILFSLTNVITLLTLPILILVKFRIWLDTARLVLLFVLQVGSAAAGSFWSPKAKCPDQTSDDIGVCQLIGVYTLIACWIIPAILVFYSTYFAVVVYLQSRIPVVVGPEPQKHRDPETGPIDLLSWSERMQEIGRAQEPNHGNVPSRSSTLPVMIQTCQSLPYSQRRSTLPDPRRQSTMPSSHFEIHSFPLIPPMAGRHRSLPAFKHGKGTDLRPLIIPGPSTASTSSHPQTPSSFSYSTPSSTNAQSQISTFGPSAVNVPSSRGSPRHLSMMPGSSSSSQGMQLCPTISSKRARLSKPIPARLL